MPVSEEIWTCLESNQITQILHDNPRPGSYSFTSLYIPIVEIFVDIHQAIRNCEGLYGEFVSNHFFKLKSRIDSYIFSTPPEAISFPAIEELYFKLNRSFGCDWTQITLFLTYHATICRLNRIPLLHFLSQFKSKDLSKPETDKLSLSASTGYVNCNYLISLCFKEAFKSAEMIATMCDSLTRIPSPHADFNLVYGLHYMIMESTVILAIVSQCAQLIQLIVETDGDIKMLCKSFMIMNLKCLSTQKSKFTSALVMCEFVQNILGEMPSPKSNIYEYCNNVHILANESIEKLYRMNGFASVRDDTTLTTEPDSIQDLSDYFFKNVTLL